MAFRIRIELHHDPLDVEKIQSDHSIAPDGGQLKDWDQGGCAICVKIDNSVDSFGNGCSDQ